MTGVTDIDGASVQEVDERAFLVFVHVLVVELPGGSSFTGTDVGFVVLVGRPNLSAFADSLHEVVGVHRTAVVAIPLLVTLPPEVLILLHALADFITARASVVIHFCASSSDPPIDRTGSSCG